LTTTCINQTWVGGALHTMHRLHHVPVSEGWLALSNMHSGSAWLAVCCACIDGCVCVCVCRSGGWVPGAGWCQAGNLNWAADNPASASVAALPLRCCLRRTHMRCLGTATPTACSMQQQGRSRPAAMQVRWWRQHGAIHVPAALGGVMGGAHCQPSSVVCGLMTAGAGAFAPSTAHSPGDFVGRWIFATTRISSAGCLGQAVALMSASYEAHDTLWWSGRVAPKILPRYPAPLCYKCHIFAAKLAHTPIHEQQMLLCHTSSAKATR
jgi:hypothetical protein